MYRFFRYELTIFFTALMFYTRIPCPKWVGHEPHYLNEATRYLPLIGWIVGLVSALVLYASSFLLPLSVCVLLALGQGVLLTGAFHEDGFADVCDGFGGGWTKSSILTIMKDSRLGTYGATGLFMLFALLWATLYEIALISFEYVLLTLWAGNSISRFLAATFIYTHEYSREDESSKVKPIAKKLSRINLIVAGIWALIPLLIFKNPFVVLLFVPMYGLKMYLGWYFQKWIGGYTGDCLGATQQLGLLLFYLGVLILLKLQLL